MPVLGGGGIHDRLAPHPLGSLALSGAGLLTIEATAVEPEGRISYANLGLYDDATEAAMARTPGAMRHVSDMPIMIQLGHAGRKASREVPWKPAAQFPSDTANGWQTVVPSALPFAPEYLPPQALDRAGWPGCARRSLPRPGAARLGLDAIQLHGAHGYLLHSFLSPLSNRRDDACGGSLENRMRFSLEVFGAVRDAFYAGKPVSVRVSATDWIEGGWDVEQTITFVQSLKTRGCSGVNASSGGTDNRQKVPTGPGYQVPLARAVKQAIRIPVIAVGMITEFEHAEAILAGGDADFVALARAMIFDPRWPWHATVWAPMPYHRAQPSRYRSLFETADQAAA